jgi:hypothetical protein
MKLKVKYPQKIFVNSEHLSLPVMNKNIFFATAIIVVLFFSFSSCKKDEFLTDSNAKLEFSEDSILFDTVFATVGSATQVFTVHNTYNRPINISSLRLANGNASFYRLNVNGTPGKTFTDVEIGAKDSIWIFVEVTIPDPSSPNTPFIVNDDIIFETNGSVQKVNLVAWGQRAHFHYNTVPNTGPFFFICNETWTNDLPHVVYGYALVDSGCTLNINEGANVHLHNNSGIIVVSAGKILVNGTFANPVTMQGDRLGIDFQDVPGQWDRIWLSNLTHSNLVNGTSEIGPGPAGNIFNYAIIKNGFVGLQSDTFAVQHQPAAVLNNCILKTFASTALFAQGSNVQANNSVFANCGEYCAAIYFGGDYRFLHCTFANFWSEGDRQTPSVLLQNHYDNVRKLDSAYFGNCIVFGSLENEIGLDSANAPFGNFNFMFDHSLLKSSLSFSSASHYKNIIRNSDPSFSGVDDNIYELYSTSPAINAGDNSIIGLNSTILNFDLKGSSRPQGANPDMGAYEKQ